MEEVTQSQKQMREAIRETTNGCVKVRRSKEGQIRVEIKKRKVTGAQKIKEKKENRAAGNKLQMVGGQKGWLIRSGEPLGSRGKNLHRGAA